MICVGECSHDRILSMSLYSPIMMFSTAAVIWNKDQEIEKRWEGCMFGKGRTELIREVKGG